MIRPDLIKRSELADRMVKRTGLLKKDCLRAIEVLTDEMVASLKSGDGLMVMNFGKFEYKVRPATLRRDPETGEQIPVPPATRIRFTPVKDVKYGVQALPWEDYVSDRQKELDWYKNWKLKESEEESS